MRHWANDLTLPAAEPIGRISLSFYRKINNTGLLLYFWTSPQAKLTRTGWRKKGHRVHCNFFSQVELKRVRQLEMTEVVKR